MEIRRHGRLAEDAEPGIDIRHIAASRELHQECQNKPQQRLAERLAVMLSLPRADHHVETFAVAVKQLLQIPDRVSPISIHDNNGVVLGGENARLDGGAVTEIVRVGDDDGTSAFGNRACFVARTIIDDDDFRFRAKPGPIQAVERCTCIANGELDRTLLIVGGDHD